MWRPARWLAPDLWHFATLSECIRQDRNRKPLESLSFRLLTVTLSPLEHAVLLIRARRGTLVGTWLRELAECWQRTPADQGGPVDRMDRAALSPMDAAGKELLAAMYTRGAILVGTALRAELSSGVPYVKRSSPATSRR